ncbi:protein arginine methyltransferase NDUFAF7, mitochondrial-like isoform X2 [Diaphorina citri]|uniref:Protein arginine methyltransferase NDUFAF7 n=1 Tax=Diaphorina citri TaxID=121845 RepID=A0A3Q0J3C3_DIACI|nr:protein arginine methyltransferase NDUFAF7, mitochondrial-like isoform X2 [Diaphorina citri]
MFSLKRNMVAFALKSFNSRAANIICHNQRSLSGINPTPNKESDKDLLFEHIKSKILLTGPITVAMYMKEILTNPSHGYYINKDVFGATGDFITSPEITQMFGELVTLWLTHEMNKINAPTNKIDIVELGPGRGTMMRDVLRTFHKLKLTSQIDNVCLVEVSKELSKIQGTSLCVPESIERYEKMLVSRKRKVSQILDTASVNDNKDNSNKENVTSDSKESKNETLEAEEQDLCYQSGTTKSGTKIKWYTSIFDVPQKNFTLFLAHEFFDALPVHKFVKTENGWREILIDFSANTNELCYVKSKNATPACLFINEKETRDHVEISLQTGVIVKNIATRLEENGGIGLIIDYGHNGEGKDTFRAYCNHKQTDPLKNIGHSDLTADVDFKYIRDSVKDKAITFGPITQREFLKQMHIDIRLNALMGVCSNDHEVKILQSAVDMLVDENQMGVRFKFLSMFPSILEDFYKRVPIHAFSEEKVEEGK